MILHLYTDYAPQGDTVRRNQLAQRTWLDQPWTELPVKDEQLPRLWKEEGRQFAYIKDMFDLACHGRSPKDIILYTNADIHCRIDCSVAVSLCLLDAHACYCYRRDFTRLDKPLMFSEYELGADYCGSDLAAFRVEWWLKYRSEMADLILGLEAWDPVFRHLVDMTNPGKIVCLRNLIGHERHGSYWENPENRYRLAGQRYCLETAAKWLLAHHIDPHRHGIPV